jgi:beta-mannosidase
VLFRSAIAYSRYTEDMARFVSEFGIQSSPSPGMLTKWASKASLALGSEGFLHRIKDMPKDKVNGMLQLTTGLPRDLDEYVEFTQLVQAEGLKFGIEHYRRRMPHCAGALIWQYNDCWPGISWSLIDFEEVPKPGWHYVARVFEPVLASFRQRDDGDVELWITNDRLVDVRASATVQLMTLAGEVLWSEVLEVRAGANSSQRVWAVGRDRLMPAADRVLVVRSASFCGNHLFFAPFRELPLQNGLPDMQVSACDDGSLEVRLTGRTFHHFVRVGTRDLKTTASDNAITLHAGEERTLRLRSPNPLKPSDVSVVQLRPISDPL